MKTTYTKAILDFYRADVEEKLAELNRRARKLGLSEVRWSFGGEYTVVEYKADGYVKTDAGGWTPRVAVRLRSSWVVVTVTGDAPKLDGWRLLAVVEPYGEKTGGVQPAIVRAVPGESVPEEFRDVDLCRCDHCGTRRRRRKAIILAHDDGRVVQVGSTCVQDYLGGASVQSIVNWASWLPSLMDAVDGFADAGYGCGRARREWDVANWLVATACVVRRCGWTPKSADFGTATVSFVWNLMDPPVDGRAARAVEEWRNAKNVFVADEDVALAVRALAWATALPVVGVCDYLANVGTVARAGYVTRKTAGIATSIVAAYLRETEKAAEKAVAEPRPVGEFVGVVGERLVFEVVVEDVKEFDGDYGTRSLVRMRDAAGNVLVWWTGSTPGWVDDAVESGESVAVRATVKSHDVWRPRNSDKEFPQTTIQRASAVAVGAK